MRAHTKCPSEMGRGTIDDRVGTAVSTDAANPQKQQIHAGSRTLLAL